MRQQRTIDILNELLVLHFRSLPIYLSYSAPWTPAGDNGHYDEVLTILDRMVADQKHYATRFAEAINDRGGRANQGNFPMEFTGLHMLSLDYLVKQIVKQQTHDIGRITELAQALEHDAQAQELAEEALGNARGHLDSLSECLRRSSAPAPSTLRIRDV